MNQRELTGALCIIWVVTLLYGEMFAFWLISYWNCSSWPHLHRLKSPTSSVMDSIRNDSDYVRIAVLTDPQLMDRTSLRLAPTSFALETAEFYSDLYMRRAFLASILPLKPDVILFLGDYFDGGPYLSNEVWQESLRRFKHIFPLNTQRVHENIQVYYLPGNHDIGYENLHSHKPEVIERHEKEFGVRNYQFTVGKVEFVTVDAQTLDGHPQGNLASSSWEFIKNVTKDGQVYPRVLLTHIPLYRRDGTLCGPNRNSPIINQRVMRTIKDQEILYQNYVTEESSNLLLDMIRPVLILSGHDHDQCTVIHNSKFRPVKEHTVGTISWQQGNLYPSFMLLSATNNVLPNTYNPGDAVITQLCFLPMQTHIYFWYLSLFVFTLFVLLLLPTSGISFWDQLIDLLRNGKQLISSSIFINGEKEKNEDLNCPYEMMWDVEGSMHLVKRILNPPVTSSSEINLLESRGNALMRPSSRKNISQESDISFAVDIGGGVGFEHTMKLPSRASKSLRKIVIQRLVRAFRAISIIAAVNVPLYVILLFKDWID